MPGAQCLELLFRHIADLFEHLVRYVGWYSTRCRGQRARADARHRADRRYRNHSARELTHHRVPDIA